MARYNQVLNKINIALKFRIKWIRLQMMQNKINFAIILVLAESNHFFDG